ncbi:hypothetical protein [Micromonospora humi]|uniref:hypothetical protein n=1 Tax=Micromonospora humi TaxID=745366 RepID=UPI001112D0E3|nr:hypothetical protein [Micromonospora humi]
MSAVEGGAESSSEEGGVGTTTSKPAPTEPARKVGFLQRLEQHPRLSVLVALATFAALFVGVLAAVPDWREMLSEAPDPTGAPPTAEGSADPSLSVGSTEPSASSPDTPGLAFIDLVVRDPERTGDENSQGEEEWTQPIVEFTVHNRGVRRSVITRVIMTVEESVVIEQCGSQGFPIAVSATYDVLLPLFPSRRSVLEAPVSQQQGADEADRFALRFSTPERKNDVTIHIYRLRFELVADGTKSRLPAGTAVVAVPHAPATGDGYFWSDEDDGKSYPFADFPNRLSLIDCMKRNSATLDRFLLEEAELSPKFAESKEHLHL